MKPKSIILLVLALGCGLVASLGINQVMANRGSAPATETVPVYVATANININDEVTKDRVKLEDWPADKVHPDALGKWEDIDGRLTNVMILQGELILNAKLLAKGDTGDVASNQIPKGFRAVAVRVDDVTSSGSLVRPGDRVDLLVHIRQNPSKGIPEEVTKTFLQDIKVFAVNDEIVRQPNGEKVAARTISLLVLPDQAQLVTLATELGNIRLVLRGNDDTATDALEPVDPSMLLDDVAENENREQESPLPKANPFDNLVAAPETVAEAPPSSEFVMTLILASEATEYVVDDSGRPGRPRDALAAPSDALSPVVPADSADDFEAEPAPPTAGDEPTTEETTEQELPDEE
jgi:pilus assembly protein CpaB